MPRVHLISSDAPKRDLERAVGISLPYGLGADCGKTIDRPRLAFLWERGHLAHFLLIAKSVCPKCKTASDGKHERYIYGIIGA